MVENENLLTESLIYILTFEMSQSICLTTFWRIILKVLVIRIKCNGAGRNKKLNFPFQRTSKSWDSLVQMKVGWVASTESNL